jgi:Cdc6-like AAA superfamily ATPase
MAKAHGMHCPILLGWHSTQTPAEQKQIAPESPDTGARLDNIANQIDSAVDYTQAFALVVLDEINAVRSNAGLATRTAAQLKTAVRNKLDAIS